MSTGLNGKTEIFESKLTDLDFNENESSVSSQEHEFQLDIIDLYSNCSDDSDRSDVSPDLINEKLDHDILEYILNDDEDISITMNIIDTFKHFIRVNYSDIQIDKCKVTEFLSYISIYYKNEFIRPVEIRERFTEEIIENKWLSLLKTKIYEKPKSTKVNIDIELIKKVNLLKKTIKEYRQDIINDFGLNIIDISNICDICMTNNICNARRNTCICYKNDLYREQECIRCYNNYEDECACPHSNKHELFDICSCNRKCILDYSTDRTRDVINSLLYSAFKRGGIKIFVKYYNIFNDEFYGVYFYIINKILDKKSDTELDIIKPLFDTQINMIIYDLYIITFSKTTCLDVLKYTLKQIRSNINERFKFYSDSNEKYKNIINTKMIKLIDIYLSNNKCKEFYINLIKMMYILIKNGACLLTNNLKTLNKRNYNKSDSIILQKNVNKILFKFLCNSNYCTSSTRKNLKRSKSSNIPLFKMIIAFDIDE